MNIELDDLPPRYRAQAEQQLAARKRRAADPLAEAVKQAKAAGRDFDSRGEYEFYTGTVLPKMARGEIVECEQHPAFPLFPAGEYGTMKLRPIRYTADFRLKYADGAVTATTRTTGELFVVADTIPPRIRPLFTDGADLTRAPAMRFRVGDNFSGIASCTLFIDGKWLPCDRLPMQGTLIHLFEEPPARKSHSVRLTLTDACGNTACWEGTIRR